MTRGGKYIRTLQVGAGSAWRTNLTCSKANFLVRSNICGAHRYVTLIANSNTKRLSSGSRDPGFPGETVFRGAPPENTVYKGPEIVVARMAGADILFKLLGIVFLLKGGWSPVRLA
jgi:hypothetical protein